MRLSQLVLEVTERQPIENLTETRRVIAALQGLGVKVAIDDVGTGHSGLSYMLKLGVDIIKIDKMFIDSLGTDRNSNTIIETLIDLAQNMRMDVIAEGVESFEQVRALARSRHPRGAGLRVLAAAAVLGVPATGRDDRPDQESAGLQPISRRPRWPRWPRLTPPGRFGQRLAPQSGLNCKAA